MIKYIVSIFFVCLSFQVSAGYFVYYKKVDEVKPIINCKEVSYDDINTILLMLKNTKDMENVGVKTIGSVSIMDYKNTNTSDLFKVLIDHNSNVTLLKKTSKGKLTDITLFYKNFATCSKNSETEITIFVQ